MGPDLAKDLSSAAGLAGNERDLKVFLEEIKTLGASDVILVPTSKDINQLKLAEEIVSSFL